MRNNFNQWTGSRIARLGITDEQILALMRELRNLKAVEKRLGLPREALMRHVREEPEFHEQLKALSDYKTTSTRYEYPSDDELLAMMARLRKFSEVSRELGMPWRALKDYLKKRPALKGKMDAWNIVNAIPEEKRERERTRRRARYQANPAKRRLRVWSENSAKHGGRPSAECREYMQMLRGDPCAYCGDAYYCIDHIEPVSRGGKTEVDNLAPSCLSCNARKLNRPLLQFLLSQR